MTAHWRGVFAALSGSVLAACASPTPPESITKPGAAGGTHAVATQQDLPSRFVGMIGVKAQHAPPFLGVPETNFYCLRSFIDRQTGDTQHQLYVADSYAGAERGWNAARDSAGHPLRFAEISREEITCSGSCSYAEEFAANLPESELRASPQGLSVTFTARSGAEKTIFVSGEQITKQLAAVGATQNPVKPTAALTAPVPPR
jgi:hypothetical protein